MIRATVISTIAALAVWTAGEPARAQSLTGSAEVVQALQAADLEWLATQGGHRIVDRSRPMELDLVTEAGFNFSFVGEACTGEGKARRCEGLTLIATWTLQIDNMAKVEALVEDFNREYPAAKAMIWNELATLERYVILTGGVTRENLMTELDVFLTLSDFFWIELDKKMPAAPDVSRADPADVRARP